MALDNFDLGIRSVTYTRNSEGELVEQDSVDWAINDYHHNLQNEESEPLVQPLTEVSLGKPMSPQAATKRKRSGAAKRSTKPKPVAQETPAAVGDELITKATEKDLRKRGLK